MKVVNIIFALFFLSYVCNAQGSCEDPDTNMDSREEAPTSYQQLEDDGHCGDGINTTAEITMCFDLTADYEDVEINMGYNHNCNNVSFSNFTLYDSDCSVFGTGLSHEGLTIGQVYTFCLDMRAWGGPVCEGFDRVCPYYYPNTPLDVHLLELKVGGEMIMWSVDYQVNSDYFTIYKSNNNQDYELLRTIPSSRKLAKIIFYSTPSDPDYSYFKLTETNFDGKESDVGTVFISRKSKNKKIFKVFDYLGREVNSDQTGLIIIQYDDHTFKKIYRN